MSNGFSNAETLAASSARAAVMLVKRILTM